MDINLMNKVKSFEYFPKHNINFPTMFARVSV